MKNYSNLKVLLISIYIYIETLTTPNNFFHLDKSKQSGQKRSHPVASEVGWDNFQVERSGGAAALVAAVSAKNIPPRAF